MDKVKLVSKDGKWVKPAGIAKFWLTFSALTIPSILMAIFYHFGLFAINFITKDSFSSKHPYFHIIPIILQAILYIIMIVLILQTALRNPGIVPSAPMDIRITDQFEQTFLRRDKSYNPRNDNHAFKTVLQLMVDKNHEYSIMKLDYQLKQNYCHTCRMSKAIRCSHTSQSGQCIQRFDHFCVYFGGDVGLFNHYNFYKMVFMIIFYLAYVGVFSLVVLVFDVFLIVSCPYKSSDKYPVCLGRSVAYNDLGLLIAALFLSVLVMAICGYFMYSINQLVQFHKHLLITGSLTKEDLTNTTNDYRIVSMFSHFDVMKNMKQTKTNQKKIDVFVQYMRSKNVMLELVKSDASIVNYLQLYEKLLQLKQVDPFLCELMTYIAVFMQRQGDDYEEFEYQEAFLKEGQPELAEIRTTHTQVQQQFRIYDERLKDAAQNGSVDVAQANGFYRDTLAALNQQLCAETIKKNQYYNSYQCSIVAVQQSADDVINNSSKIQGFKQQHPEWFEKTATDVLQLLICCNPNAKVQRQLNHQKLAKPKRVEMLPVDQRAVQQ